MLGQPVGRAVHSVSLRPQFQEVERYVPRPVPLIRDGVIVHGGPRPQHTMLSKMSSGYRKYEHGELR